MGPTSAGLVRIWGCLGWAWGPGSDGAEGELSQPLKVGRTRAASGTVRTNQCPYHQNKKGPPGRRGGSLRQGPRVWGGDCCCPPPSTRWSLPEDFITHQKVPELSPQLTTWGTSQTQPALNSSFFLPISQPLIRSPHKRRSYLSLPLLVIVP